MDFICWAAVLGALPFFPLVIGWAFLFPPKGQTTPGVLLVLPIPLAFVGYVLLTVFISNYFIPLVIVEALGLISVWKETR
jgi:hypothetical protein